MKIKQLEKDFIIFDNGNVIRSEYKRECCEYNYADFEQCDMLCLLSTFKEDLIFEDSEYGFRFGNKNNMFFVPCYSFQNSNYSNNVDIYYKDKKVLSVNGKIEF